MSKISKATTFPSITCSLCLYSLNNEKSTYFPFWVILSRRQVFDSSFPLKVWSPWVYLFNPYFFCLIRSFRSWVFLRGLRCCCLRPFRFLSVKFQEWFTSWFEIVARKPAKKLYVPDLFPWWTLFRDCSCWPQYNQKPFLCLTETLLDPLVSSSYYRRSCKYFCFWYWWVWRWVIIRFRPC